MNIPYVSSQPENQTTANRKPKPASLLPVNLHLPSFETGDFTKRGLPKRQIVSDYYPIPGFPDAQLGIHPECLFSVNKVTHLLRSLLLLSEPYQTLFRNLRLKLGGTNPTSRGSYRQGTHEVNVYQASPSLPLIQYLYTHSKAEALRIQLLMTHFPEPRKTLWHELGHYLWVLIAPCLPESLYPHLKDEYEQGVSQVFQSLAKEASSVPDLQRALQLGNLACPENLDHASGTEEAQQRYEEEMAPLSLEERNHVYELTWAEVFAEIFLYFQEYQVYNRPFEHPRKFNLTGKLSPRALKMQDFKPLYETLRTHVFEDLPFLNHVAAQPNSLERPF